jgi:phosphatidylserine/phosphatidylglycerophosphate/cardiolipin synthase-like enzyme
VSSGNAFRSVRARLVAGAQHHDELIAGVVAKAKVSVWIATANLKELRLQAPIGTVDRARGRYESVLDLFQRLARRGVELRILHAGLPSRAFRAARARQRSNQGLSLRRCPRVHLKIIAVDGLHLYVGSANFTGAGLGAKADGRRNFELGILTEDDVWLDAVQGQFERIWSGAECAGCKVRAFCPAPLDVPKGRRLKISGGCRSEGETP